MCRECYRKQGLSLAFLNSSGAILIEPLKKITYTNYTCGKSFNLEPNLEMFKDENIFGIVFVTGKMYAIYKIIKNWRTPRI